MVAHYYESKQDIILAALRLILLRIEERLNAAASAARRICSTCSAEALPIDEQRFTECAFWMAFWGQVSADKKLRGSMPGCIANTCACSRAASPSTGPSRRNGRATRDQVLRSW
jgi:AcrR family transcriptional regulator